jgi:hypothetical protein
MKRTLLTASITAVVIAFSAGAAAQATFETLMTHSVSTAVGTHAGTALGNATNALANRVAGQTATATRPNAARQTLTTRRAGATKAAVGSSKSITSPASAKPSGNGSLIASIQGGERTRPGSVCAQGAETGDAKGANQSCGAETAHPAVINLPAPQ